MTIAPTFDAVLMLTWSDWKTEPRSNRFHYATRFAKSVPVLFLQHTADTSSTLRVERSEIENIDVVHVAPVVDERQAAEIYELLSMRGISKPLIWIYDSMNYRTLIDQLPQGFRVYHATEDYLTETKAWSLDTNRIGEAVIRLLPKIDYLVACSAGVAESYLTKGGYEGDYAIIENGCDAEFFLRIAETHSGHRESDRPVAIFQGGINQRLDYDLLLELATRMPDWDFQFCGNEVRSAKWLQLKGFANVEYCGRLNPEQFGALMARATVGIIPFIQDQWIKNSWPLKAYEYVACGLPVVTVPIAALETQAELFSAADTATGFEAALREAAGRRHDSSLAALRRASALANSYDLRYEKMVRGLLEARRKALHSRNRASIAILYDGIGSMHVSTIREHLEAFRKYSRHDLSFISATSAFWNRAPEETESLIDFSVFDVLIVHYSVRISVRGHLDEGVTRAMARFHGLKILFIQDEYEAVEQSRGLMDRVRFDVVYTCVPREFIDDVYPAYRYPWTEFLSTLTGYVPEDPHLEEFALPLSERKVDIAYRGRELPPIYGELGYEKYRIGVEMKAIAARRGLRADIEVDDSKRIYGRDWYRFLGSARATLGTESGSNIFDFDGSLKERIDALIKDSPGRPPRELAAPILEPHEGRVRMNQISPKIFEAIRLRTALILFEGEYSGVVRADEHFISLRKDFSNVEEVLGKLQDDVSLQAMTDCAYRDVVASGEFSYQRFVAGIDADVDARVYRRGLADWLQGPALKISENGSIREALPAMPRGVWRGAHPLGRPLSLVELGIRPPGSERKTLKPIRNKLRAIEHEILKSVLAIFQLGWHRLPVGIKQRLIKVAQRVFRHTQATADRNAVVHRLAQGAWHLLPLSVRTRLAQILERN